MQTSSPTPTTTLIRTNTIPKRQRLGLVVAGFVIVFLALVAIPNFLPPRITMAQNACVNNLRWIQTAKERWAETHHKGPSDRPTESDLFPESNSSVLSTGTNYAPAALRQMPGCPAGGTYTIGAINEDPKCSIGPPAHSLRSH